MTQRQHIECDTCGATIPVDEQPDYVLAHRVNNSVRFDICKQCFGDDPNREQLSMAMLIELVEARRAEGL